MNEVHEPEVVGKIENAIAYFVILGFVSLGLVFVLGGMISPVFLPYFLNRAKTQKDKWYVIARIAIWFILTWAIFIKISWKYTGA